MDFPFLCTDQVVRVRAPHGGWRKCCGEFVVVSVAPCEGCETLYLVRCISDGHERVVVDGEIRPADDRAAVRASSADHG